MKKTKLITIILVCVFAVLIAGSILYFYFFNDSVESELDVLKDAPRTEYTVSIKTEGNMLLPNIDVFVYFDSTCEKLIDYAKTDNNGMVTFVLAEYDKYAVVFSGILEGYDVADYYTFDGNSLDITFSSGLIKNKDIYDASFAVGNVMYDWEVTTDNGNTLSVSDILDKNKMLVINFWYKDSPSSVEQLKIFNDIYAAYTDSAEIIALNPVDDIDSIKAFKESNSLNFPMATCSRRIPARFGASRCPMTIIVDRYGVISFIDVGTVSSVKQLESVFDYFTDDEYVQKLYRSGMTEFVSELMPAPTVFEVVAKDQDNEKIPGVELKLTTADSSYTVTTDENGVARFEVTTKLNDLLTVFNYPDGYKYNGKEEIVLSDDMFTYNVVFESLNND